MMMDFSELNVEEVKRLQGRHQQIIERCYNPNNKDYKRYGARGCQVHSDWRNNGDGAGFRRFAEWMLSQGWTPESTDEVDRINDALMYGPDTCRLATKDANNRYRSSVYLTSVRLTDTEIAKICGVGQSTVSRVRRKGRSVAAYMEAKLVAGKRRVRLDTLPFSEEMALSQSVCPICGEKAEMIYHNSYNRVIAACNHCLGDAVDIFAAAFPPKN